MVKTIPEPDKWEIISMKKPRMTTSRRNRFLIAKDISKIPLMSNRKHFSKKNQSHSMKKI